jgi:glyoxalase family protein
VKLDGLHHVTAITADVAANLDFYGRLLRLRLVWQGVNADDPEMRHLAYGDERGSPGSIVTFFDMPGVLGGRPGEGMVHRLLLRVAGDEALDFWERRLAGAGVASERMADRLVFSDPEGLGLELVVDDGQDEPLIAAAADVDTHVAIRGIQAVHAYGADPERASPVVGGVLGMEPEGEARWLARCGCMASAWRPPGFDPRRCWIGGCSSRSTSASRAACCSSSPPMGRGSSSSHPTGWASRSC